MCLTWPDDNRSNDFVFRCDGHDAGRCYLRELANNEMKWHWTIYIGTHASRPVEGVPIVGNADTLDQAKAEFRKSFDAMLAAGVVKFRSRQDERAP